VHSIGTTQLQHVNISFSMNHHHTFVWPRYANREDFHSCMLPFYLDEEAFDKEVMSWPGVKRNPHKSGMHYVLPVRATEEERSGSRGRTELRPGGTEERSPNTDGLRQGGRDTTTRAQKEEHYRCSHNCQRKLC
jgi:hypothetical protein